MNGTQKPSFSSDEKSYLPPVKGCRTPVCRKGQGQAPQRADRQEAESVRF